MRCLRLRGSQEPVLSPRIETPSPVPGNFTFVGGLEMTKCSVWVALKLQWTSGVKGASVSDMWNGPIVGLAVGMPVWIRCDASRMSCFARWGEAGREINEPDPRRNTSEHFYQGPTRKNRWKSTKRPSFLVFLVLTALDSHTRRQMHDSWQLFLFKLILIFNYICFNIHRSIKSIRIINHIFPSSKSMILWIRWKRDLQSRYWSANPPHCAKWTIKPREYKQKSGAWRRSTRNTIRFNHERQARIAFLPSDPEEVLNNLNGFATWAQNEIPQYFLP